MRDHLKAFALFGLTAYSVLVSSAISNEFFVCPDSTGHLTWTNTNPDLYYTVEARPNLTGQEEWDGSYVHLRDIQSSEEVVSVPIGVFYRVTGSETQKHTRTLSPSSSELAAGYYEAAILSDVDGNLSPGNVRTGTSIFGVSGTVIEAAGSAPDSAVLSGATFSRAGEANRIGTMANVESQHVMPGTSEQAILRGYHDGTGAVAGDPNLAASNIVSGVTLFNVTGTAVPLEHRVEALESVDPEEWVRSGSNADGSWVQFSDGTMICYGNSFGPVDVNQSKGRGVESQTVQKTFASSFSEPPVVAAGVAGGGNLNVWGTASGSVGSANLRAHAFTERSGVTLSAQAFGKWKTDGVPASAIIGNAGQSTQTHTDLQEFGPRAGRVVLSSQSWNGTFSQEIARFGEGAIPVGETFILVIPRTIGSSGGPSGHGENVLGHFVSIRDKNGSSDPQWNIECVANSGRSYYAYPNACDFRGNDAALQEHLMFQRTPEGWALIQLPAPRTGFTHGNPMYVSGTTSRRGFAWERRADGTAKISNGTVRILSYSAESGSGDSGPRFRGVLQFPFRLEPYQGNQRNIQFGISTQDNSNVPFASISMPQDSLDSPAEMDITVYVDDDEQSNVTSSARVAVTITGFGNWKIKGTAAE